ncbi:MAG: phosphotransferase [Clostridia bacterium]|nr:phosphotransferase [Clostridia bacterium]
MNMKTENGVLTVFLEGRIDSTNAEAKGAELTALIAGTPHESLTLDTEALSYISSAGLRVLLRIRKSEPELKIVNAGSELYDIFEMTGFTEMMTIEKAYRKMSVDGCPVIGQGAKGTVYRYNEDTIVKVYKFADCLPDIKHEREMARRAFVLGIPTAISYDIVKVGDQFGSVFELLNAKSFSQLIMEEPDKRTYYIDEYARLLRRIHGTEVKETDMPYRKPEILKQVDSAAPWLGEADTEKLRSLITALPDVHRMLHCDYHTNNVMSQGGETLMIDMDTLSWGHPIFDLSIVYSVYQAFNETNPNNAHDFLGMTVEACDAVWERFLPVYLGTDAPDVLCSVGKKIELLGHLRVVRFIVKHSDPSEAEAGRRLAVHIGHIRELLRSVTTLDF